MKKFNHLSNSQCLWIIQTIYFHKFADVEVAGDLPKRPELSAEDKREADAVLVRMMNA